MRQAGARPAKPYKGMAMEGLIARWYARIRADDPAMAASLAEIEGLVPAGSRVLEIAPGPGYLAVELARRGYEVSGVDISRSFVEMADERARGAGVRADFRHGDAAHMPFADRSFDLTVCQAAFKNFTDPVGALREMHRVLRPGGLALISDLRRDASASDVDEHIAELGVGGVNAAFTRLVFRRFLLRNAYTAGDIRCMVGATGFAACAIRETSISLEITLDR